MEEDLVLATDYGAQSHGIEAVIARRRFDVLSSRSSSHEALEAMTLRDGARYRIVNNYGANSSSSVCHCVTHKGCHNFIRLVTTSSEGAAVVVSLQESDIHGGEMAVSAPFGISVLMKQHVGAVLSGGAGPIQCLKILQESYKAQPAMSRLVPTPQRLKNREAHVKNAAAGMFFQEPPKQKQKSSQIK